MGCGATPQCRYFQLICRYFLTLLLLFSRSYPRAFSVVTVINTTDLANQSDPLDANKFDLFANQPDASIATESDNSIGHQSDDSISKESDNSIAKQFNDSTVHKGDLIRIDRKNCIFQRSFHPHRIRIYPFGRRAKFDDGLLQLNVLSTKRQLRRTFVDEAMVEGKHMLQPSARKFFEERSSYLGPSARKRRRRKAQEIATLPSLPANPSVIIADDNREIHRNNGELVDLSSAREKLTQGRSLQLDFSFSSSSSSRRIRKDLQDRSQVNPSAIKREQFDPSERKRNSEVIFLHHVPSAKRRKFQEIAVVPPAENPSVTDGQDTEDEIDRNQKRDLAIKIAIPVASFVLVLAILMFLFVIWRGRKSTDQENQYSKMKMKKQMINVMMLMKLKLKTLLEKKKKKQKRLNHADEVLLETLGSGLPPRFTYAEIVEATNGFANKLGEGGYGAVYEGKVPHTGSKIAVKVFMDTSSMACRKGFYAEVMSIGERRHRNLVPLCGFCAEDEHRMLVYELMAKGSLNKVLFSSPRKEGGEDEKAGGHGHGHGHGQVVLSWERRHAIAMDTARALAFLHEGDEKSRVIHCDVKPENILLDEEWEAKVSDFGLAKLLAAAAAAAAAHHGHGDGDGEHHADADADAGDDDGEDDGGLTAPSRSKGSLLSGDNKVWHLSGLLRPRPKKPRPGGPVPVPDTSLGLSGSLGGVRGTFGYLAPEWTWPDSITPASDVYSFGVVLLELVAGRRSLSRNLPFLPGLAFDILADPTRDLLELLDPRLHALSDSFDPAHARSLAKLALWCLQEDLELRPPMAKVLDMLADLPSVPDPPVCDYFAGSSHFFEADDDAHDHQRAYQHFTSSFGTFTTTTTTHNTSQSRSSLGTTRFIDLWQVSIVSAR